MITVSIIGGGNLAQHLIKAVLSAKNVKLVQVFNRNMDRLNHLSGDISITNKLTELQLVDLLILAISDDAIKDFSRQLNTSALVVHTSGTVSLKALKTMKRSGVFYPVQTFSQDRSVQFKKIPICLETSDSTDLFLLEKVASALSNNVYFLDSKQRKKLHLAAVFANNFTNHMFSIADAICSENDIPFEILYPLIKETTKKLKTHAPRDIQTGPAQRGDLKTIEKQETLLNPEQRDIYKSITNSILKSAKNHE